MSTAVTRYRRGSAGHLLDEPPTPEHIAWVRTEDAQLRLDLRNVLELYWSRPCTTILRLAVKRSADVDAFREANWGILGQRPRISRWRVVGEWAD